MRKFTKSLMALVLLIGGTTTANASLQPGTKYTSVDQLSGKVFAIVDEAAGKAFYGPTGGYGHEVGFDVYATAFTNDVNFYYFKLVDIPAEKIAEKPELADYTLIRACNADGSFYTFWGDSGNGYLNTNNDICFLLGITAKNLGENFDYAAVWKVTYVDGKGFTIQNKYTGDKYLTNAGCPNNDNPTYFSFCTVGEPSHMLHFTNGEAQLGSPWAYTANYTLTTPLTAGTTYVFEAIINAVNGGATRLVNICGSDAQFLETKGLWANEFTRYHIEFTASAAHDKLEIDLGECGGDVYIDNVSLKVKNTDANLIANGDFETGTDGWSAAGNTMERVEKVLDAIKDPGILISVGEAGWKTFRTGSNMEITDPSVKAYVAKYVSEGNYVKLTEVTKVPEWEPVLIEAPRGNYQAEIRASVDGFPGDENGLKVNGGSELTANGTQYGLGKVDGVVGFYRISDKVPAWKIYLEISGGAPGAPEFLGFGGDDMTGIDMVKGERFKVKGEFYNLKGQRVAQPTKGLYIVNGKKVVIK